jgi:SAM-dependent methyltransferase
MERIESYRDVTLHRRIGTLIKERSENKEDIRRIAFKALGPKAIRSMLNLGCGYGWFEEALEKGLDLIVGVDVHEENRDDFLEAAQKKSATCLFVHSSLPAPIDAPTGSFDLVVAIYSLYFFTGVLPEVKRLLAADGTFLAITHSEAMLEEAEEFFQFRSMRKTIERFSAENGEAILKGYFGSVTHVDYENCLVFGAEDRDDLRDYVYFKREFITGDADPDLVKERLFCELDRKGVLRFNKNDRIFVARK